MIIMVTREEAEKIVLQKLDGFKITKLVIEKNYYIFYMAPKVEESNSNSVLNEYTDCAFKVDKKTGSFSGYNPLID